METDIKDVYAVGDCAEAPSIITHRPMCAQLGTIAVRQGKVGGANAGGDYSLFTGILASAVTRLFEIEAGNTGLTETSAALQPHGSYNWNNQAQQNQSGLFPRGKTHKIKLCRRERISKRIVGAQIIGGEEVTQRVNCISFAIQKA